MTARTGRDKQSKSVDVPFFHHNVPSTSLPPNTNLFFLGYSPAGERLVAGVVPLSPDKTRVLLIQSSKRTTWVLPKGGWETDEATAMDAAKREAWEEAGIHCTVTKDLGRILDTRGPKEVTSSSPKALYQFYQVRVDKEAAEWPEKHKRGRQWMNYREAKDKLKSRPELLAALEKSDVVK